MMTDFTPEFIQTELAKAAKATPRPYEKFDRFIRYKVEDSQGYQEWMPYNQHYRNGTAEDDADWLVAAANHYEEALREIERLKEQGYMAMEARGWEAAASIIAKYLEMRDECKITRRFDLWRLFPHSALSVLDPAITG